MTSAKQNTGINKMFQKAAEMCAKHMELRNDIDVSTFIDWIGQLYAIMSIGYQIGISMI